mmetsp:Transcript_14796/g.45183  ORF Transcript_14796/g.45183 Transcript_14796/m.45183 type:complete len:80 (+) Transcript_14796:67-306(+)
MIVSAAGSRHLQEFFFIRRTNESTSLVFSWASTGTFNATGSALLTRTRQSTINPVHHGIRQVSSLRNSLIVGSSFLAEA